MGKQYFVYMQEVHVNRMVIEADSESDAVNRVQDGEGDSCHFEYSHTLESDTWTVELAE